jgi:alpha-acetolactate decarboxylase
LLCSTDLIINQSQISEKVDSLLELELLLLLNQNEEIKTVTNSSINKILTSNNIFMNNKISKKLESLTAKMVENTTNKDFKNMMILLKFYEENLFEISKKVSDKI